ncbi:MAG: hypothetical protein Q4G40_03485 [Brachybacterium sp.]|nr:hypothetical protein [Brachybacterium sp.]
MSDRNPGPATPAERQGALTEDLARVLLASVELPDRWRRLSCGFIPDGEGWAGRIVVIDAAGPPSGGDARFGTDSQISLLMDALQQTAADQQRPFVSLRLDIGRSDEDSASVALGAEVNEDQDPGSFDGIGGVDAVAARRFADRFGEDAMPPWMRERLAGD